MEIEETRRASALQAVRVSRRGFVLGGMAATVSLGMPVAAWAAPGDGSSAADKATVEKGQRAARALRSGQLSENGWLIESQANAGGGVWNRGIPGTPLSIDLSSSVAGNLLLYVTARLYKEVREFPQEGLVGFVGEGGRVHAQSNHRSGTAINLSFSMGRRVTGSFFTPSEVSLVEDIVSSTQGVIVWAGASGVPPARRNESYFDIAIGPDSPKALDVARRLTPWGVIK